MSIYSDLFRVDNTYIIKGHNIVCCRLRSIKNMLPAFEEYLAFCKDVMP